MLLTVPWSSDPIVSFKYTLVALTHWYLFTGLLLLLSKDLSSINPTWFRYYALPFLGILLYAWYHHAQYDFSVDTSVLVARPFYFDHALLSTAILLLLGIEVLQITQRGKGRWFAFIMVTALVLGVYLSFSRAAWLSAFIAITAILVLILAKRFPRVIAGIFLSGLLVFFLSFNAILSGITNNQVESKKGNWWQQIVSITNVSTDVSNLERLNRYKCALRMTADRPWTGFGAGTFQVAYLPYQLPDEMTRISVTHPGPHPPGRGGGAHSEYLQAFSELGVLGGCLFLLLVCWSIWTAIRIYWRAPDPYERHLALALLFGLLTFFIHGWFNNFLHQEKIAVLVWSSIGLLGQLDREIESKRMMIKKGD